MTNEIIIQFRNASYTKNWVSRVPERYTSAEPRISEPDHFQCLWWIFTFSSQIVTVMLVKIMTKNDVIMRYVICNITTTEIICGIIYKTLLVSTEDMYRQ